MFRGFLQIGRTLESVLGDWLMGVNTRSSLYFDSARGLHRDAYGFDTVAHLAIIKTIKLAQPTSEDIVFVLGCGKGRTLCHFMRFPVRKVIGIEIDESLCEIARNNALRLRGAIAPAEILNVDAAEANVEDGTVFFMFNPFGAQTLRHVLHNIHIQSYRRAVRIIYMGAWHASVFTEFPEFEVLYDYRRVRGQRVIIYRSTTREEEREDVGTPQRIRCEGTSVAR